MPKILVQPFGRLGIVSLSPPTQLQLGKDLRMVLRDAKNLIKIVSGPLIKQPAESNKRCRLKGSRTRIPKKRCLIQEFVNRLVLEGDRMHSEIRIEKLGAGLGFSPKYLKLAFKL
jgi:hypothetical protein